ncbi:hypothetical protein [Methanosarcina siciliae]|nr:hypothetical protein [Methanosarcina siciliae]
MLPGKNLGKIEDENGRPVENVKCDLQNAVEKRRKLVRKERTI